MSQEEYPGNNESIQYMPRLRYVVGDATAPVGAPNKLIIHICNDVGKWDKGFVLALSKRWKHPEEIYRSVNPKELKIGMTQIIQVAPTIWVANIVAQHGVTPIGTNATGRMISYDALATGLYNVSLFIKQSKQEHNQQISIHMPRIGCGQGGAKWECVEGIIKGELSDSSVTVYD
jgi:O-acetyl-ADP-ribose deacetylase (regulator of RNase III)